MQVFNIKRVLGEDSVVLVLPTPRERQVLRLVSHGALNKQIAYELQISLSTVKSHIARCALAMGFSNRVQVARWVYYHPEALTGHATDLSLHLPGCRCGGARCEVMRALDAPPKAA